VLMAVLLAVIQVLVGTGRSAGSPDDPGDAAPTEPPPDTVPLPTSGQA